MKKLSLPFWMNGARAKAIIEAAQVWFERFETWLLWPLSQLDAETCELGILNLIAHQRGISRLPKEPESLYRLRVKHAYVNATDAGSFAGMQRIFERLGIAQVEVFERQPGRDWDIVVLRTTDEYLHENQALLDAIFQLYGRTCRRYEWNLTSPLTMGVKCYEFYEDQSTIRASL